jgi:hypothetical protein
MECRNPNMIRTSPELKRILDDLPAGRTITGFEPSGDSEYVLKGLSRSKLCGHIPPSAEYNYSFGEEKIRVTITEFPNVNDARSALLSTSSWFFDPLIKSEFSVSTEAGDAMLCTDRMLTFVRYNMTVQISALSIKDHLGFAKELDAKILKK